MFPYNYALEKLSNAVSILATGEGDVRSRLWAAYLEFHPLQVNDFPPELQDDYAWVVKELTKRKPRGWLERDVFGFTERDEWAEDGIVQANLRRMKNRTGSRIAQKICDLEYRVRLAYGQWQQSLGKPPK